MKSIYIYEADKIQLHADFDELAQDWGEGALHYFYPCTEDEMKILRFNARIIGKNQELLEEIKKRGSLEEKR